MNFKIITYDKLDGIHISLVGRWDSTRVTIQGRLLVPYSQERMGSYIKSAFPLCVMKQRWSNYNIMYPIHKDTDYAIYPDNYVLTEAKRNSVKPLYISCKEFETLQVLGKLKLTKAEQKERDKKLKELEEQRKVELKAEAARKKERARLKAIEDEKKECRARLVSNLKYIDMNCKNNRDSFVDSIIETHNDIQYFQI